MTVNTPGRACGHFSEMTEPVLGLGNAALEYARLGYAVLPLHRGGKKPDGDLVPHGVHEATRDEQDIRAWWHAKPAANVGVATGSGLVVADLDVRGNGTAEFDRMRGAQPFGWPGVVRTPSGGWHLWYHWPWGGPVPNRTAALPGVDVKGTGGYVVAPPSALIVPGLARPGEQRGGATVPIPYEWVRECACRVAVVPEWLAKWVVRSQSHPETVNRAGGSGGVASEQELVHAERGRRNDMFTAKALSLARAGWSIKDTTTELHRIWSRMGSREGFPWTEIEAAIGTAYRKKDLLDQEEAEQQQQSGARAWAEGLARGYE